MNRVTAFLSSIGSAIAAGLRAVGGYVANSAPAQWVAGPARSVWLRCVRTGKWIEEKVPGGRVLMGGVGGAALGAGLGLAVGGTLAGLALVGGAPLSVVGGIAAAVPLVAAEVGAVAGMAVGVRDTVRSNGGVKAILGRVAGGAADVAVPAARGLGQGGAGLGRSTLTTLGNVVRAPGRLLGSIGFGGGVPAPGSDAYQDGAAATGAQAPAGQDPARAKRDAQVARQLASAVRGAAACRADAIDETRPEEGSLRDRGLPANLTGWLDRLSPDELRVIARLPSEDVLKLIEGGQVLGVRPISTKENGMDCINNWTAAMLAEETDRNEALRQAVTHAEGVPMMGGPDAAMAALHDLDQRYREQTAQAAAPRRPTSVHGRWQAIVARKASPAPVGGMTVH